MPTDVETTATAATTAKKRHWSLKTLAQTTPPTVRFTLVGVLFGLGFPLTATLLHLWTLGLALNVANAVAVHADSPVLLLVDTAPLVLGLAGYLVGRNKAYTQQLIRTLEHDRHLAEQTTHALLNAAPGSLYLVDETLRILEINNVGAQRFGRKRDKMRGRLMSDFVMPGIVAEHAQVFSALSEGQDMWEGSTAYRDRFLRTQAFPVRAQECSVQRVAFFTEDVTDQKRLVRNLSHAKQLAEEAARQKSEFVANMSHEIRTPLNGIFGMLDVLLAGELNADQRDCAATARRAADGLKIVVDEVLDFSKLEANHVTLERVPFSPERLVNDTLAIVASAADETVELRCTIAADVPAAVMGDPFRIRQVLLNLLNNALKFTKRGHVGIHARLGKRMKDGYRLVFEVHDTGIGIPSNKLRTIFSSFKQADGSTTRKFGGTGLGLAICRKLALLMRGDVSVRSEMGTGSTFCVTVRCDEASAQQAAQLLASDHSQPDNSVAELPALPAGSRLLVVDDNQINRKVAKSMLGKLGFDVDLANDGREAVDACANEQYAIVFMDCQMPVMSGYEATKAICALPQCADTAIIAMTASASSEVRKDCLDVGMVDYIAKPISLNDLRDALRRWLGRALSNAAAKAKAVDVALAVTNVVKTKTATIDTTKLDDLCDMMDGDPTLLAELVDAFEAETPGDCRAVRDAVQSRDAQALVAQAHRLRSSAGNLGATIMWELCTLLEDLGRAGDLDAAELPANRLLKEQERAARALRSDLRARIHPNDNQPVMRSA